MGVVLSYMDSCDKSISGKIHKMKSNMMMDYTLSMPAMIFQPLAYPLILAAIAFLYPNVEMELSNIHSVADIDEEKRLDYNGTFLCVLYIVNVFTLLGVTTFLKKFFNRPRPEMPEESANNYRSVDFRTKETNNSLPSGDAA
jgi:hypothetical protein